MKNNVEDFIIFDSTTNQWVVFFHDIVLMQSASKAECIAYANDFFNNK